jgi:2-polyprenyl-3-methyl-5-hydroxy-6-metoxy-1,4-benzoquinol methylase
LYPDGYNHWIRVIMDQETARLVGGLDFKHAAALDISGTKWKDFGFARFRSVSDSEYDVCAGVLGEKFDVIIAEQVFEHVLWPYCAVRNVFQMLNPNGAFLITTHF